MRGPHGLELSEHCQSCRIRTNQFFCQLTAGALKDLDTLRYVSAYPRGTLLFVEQQEPRGIYILCQGQVKLSVNSREGRTLILRIARPGEALGLMAVLSGRPFEVTAETLRSCQLVFIRRDHFLRLLAKYPEAYKAVVTQLGLDYGNACEQLRTLGLAASVTNRLAKLLLDWSAGGEKTKEGIRITLSMTHEEIADCIGTTRESVTRTLTEFRNRRLIAHQGSTLTIPNRAALMNLVAA
jgi:CRP/FNR family cyclic AMP-dependent transcriptional regulator